jgi:hypothetical protein
MCRRTVGATSSPGTPHSRTPMRPLQAPCSAPVCGQNAGPTLPGGTAAPPRGDVLAQIARGAPRERSTCRYAARIMQALNVNRR